jgi:hypothetical protein
MPVSEVATLCKLLGGSPIKDIHFLFRFDAVIQLAIGAD